MSVNAVREYWSRVVIVTGCVMTSLSFVAEAAQQASAAQQSSQSVQAVPPSASAGSAGHVPGSLASSDEEVAGEFFGQPVSLNNYAFAKRVAMMFPRPWGAPDLTGQALEDFVWEQLLLHYASFQRGIQATDDELEVMVNELLRNQGQSFSRRGDPEAYQRWVRETLGYDAAMLENHIRYLIQIRKLNEQILQEQRVTVTEEEMQQEFLNEQHHVGGEMVVFETRDLADAFFRKVHDGASWETMRAKGDHPIRPVSLMTLEAYVDLWQVPKTQMDALHAMALGSVAPPMPFGSKQWCVYHLLEKRVGDLKDFPPRREAYFQQVQLKKKYDAQQRWIQSFKDSAKLRVTLRPQ